MAAEEEGIASTMWQSARDASSMMSALCSRRMSWTSVGTKASTETVDRDSSLPMLRSSQSSVREARTRESSWGVETNKSRRDVWGSMETGGKTDRFEGDVRCVSNADERDKWAGKESFEV